NFSTLKNNFCPYLHGPERRGCVGCKIGITRSRGKYHHPALLQMADSPSPYILLCQFSHLDGRLNSCLQSKPLKRVLKGKGVDNRCKHTHIIRGRPFHALYRCLNTSEYIAAAYHNGNLYA